MSWCAFDTTAPSSNRGNQCLSRVSVVLQSASILSCLLLPLARLQVPPRPSGFASSLLVDRPVEVHAPAVLPILQPHADVVSQYAKEAFLRNFGFWITHFLVPTWTSSKVSLSFCFRITYLFPLKLGVNFPGSRWPQIRHLPLPDHDVELFVSYQHNHVVFLDSVYIFLPERFLFPALEPPTTWLRFLYPTSALQVSYQSRHEEWICRLVECKAGPPSTRSHQVLLRGCCAPGIDGIFPPVHLPWGSTGTSYSVEFHLTWESFQNPLTRTGVHCQYLRVSKTSKNLSEHRDNLMTGGTPKARCLWLFAPAGH